MTQTVYWNAIMTDSEPRRTNGDGDVGLRSMFRVDRGTVPLLIVLAIIIAAPMVGYLLSPDDEPAAPIAAGASDDDAIADATSASATGGPSGTIVAATNGGGNGSASAPTNSAYDRSTLQHTLSIPLTNGKVHFGQVLGQIAEQFGLDGSPVRKTVALELDAKGIAGSIVLQGLQSFTGDVVTFAADDAMFNVTFDRLQLRRNDQAMRSKFRGFLSKYFPEAAEEVGARYGLYASTAEGERRPLDSVQLPEHVVVLVHGVDDPGFIFNTLRPIVANAGHTVCDFDYANDGPIREASALLAGEMKRLRAAGVKRVSIVAHSMGGLVSREMLTSPALYAGKGRGHEQYPDVERLIMIGTPNHGSPLAHLLIATEVRDQVCRALSGDGLLFGAFFDGIGEAKLDLLPKSDFLNELNARPHAEGVAMTLIAGNASPVSESKITDLAGTLKQKFGTDLNGSVDKLSDSLRSIVQTVGDGAVSVDSVKLDGVTDFHVVDGNHMSMVRQMNPWTRDVPAAIPLVMERLNSAK